MAHHDRGYAAHPAGVPAFSYAAGYYPLACWQPAADVYRNPQGWTVKLELAGVRAEDVEVAVEGRRLSIGGMRRDRPMDDAHRAYSMEIAYNQFLRSIEFPDSLDGLRVSTEYRDGMLLVYLTTEATP